MARIFTAYDEGPLISYDPTQRFNFFRAQSFRITIKAEHFYCVGQGKIEVKQSSQIITWKQITGNEALGIDATKRTTATSPFSDITIPAYATLTFKTYKINVTATLTTSPISVTQTLTVYVDQSPLVALIQGGSRIAAYSAILVLNASLADPDLDPSHPKPLENITVSWSCVDLITKGSCKNVEGSALTFQTNSSLQRIPKFSLAPYKSYEFTLQATKGSRTMTNQVKPDLSLTEFSDCY